MIDLRTDTPSFTRQLAVTVRFLDPFTNQPVRTPLAVSIPVLNWSATWMDADATYRFSLPNVPLVGGVPQLPMGTFDLRVDLPGRPMPANPPSSALPRGAYAAFETRQITFPLNPPHTPPVYSDFKVDLSLWPTVAFRVPPGETAVVGGVVSASNQNVIGLKVILLDTSVPPPPISPYARTDGAGQFLYRLPALRSAGAVDSAATVSVQAFDVANNPITVVPSNLTIPIGQVTRFAKLNIA